MSWTSDMPVALLRGVVATLLCTLLVGCGQRMALRADRLGQDASTDRSTVEEPVDGAVDDGEASDATTNDTSELDAGEVDALVDDLDQLERELDEIESLSSSMPR